MSISIGIGTIEDALTVEESIPEFSTTRTVNHYIERLGNKHKLILIAQDGAKPVGYKVGYELEETIFYSWLGGVAPEYRRMGLAQQLMEMQETWAHHHGYKQIQVKSMNRFPAMLILLIQNGYQITNLEQGDNSGPANSPEQLKIIFQKTLDP